MYHNSSFYHNSFYHNPFFTIIPFYLNSFLPQFFMTWSINKNSINSFTAYREKTFTYNINDYMRATYNLSELLLKTQLPFDNSTDYDITELKSVNLGRCYMICFNQAHRVTDVTYLWVKRNSDLIGKNINCSTVCTHSLHHSFSW